MVDFFIFVFKYFMIGAICYHAGGSNVTNMVLGFVMFLIIKFNLYLLRDMARM